MSCSRPCFSVSVIMSLGRLLSVFVTPTGYQRRKAASTGTLHGPGDVAGDRDALVLERPRLVQRGAGLFERGGGLLELRPLPLPLPDADRQLLGHPLLEPAEQLEGDVLAGGDRQDRVEVDVV